MKDTLSLKKSPRLMKIDPDVILDKDSGMFYSNTNITMIAGKRRPKIKEDFMFAFLNEFALLAEKKLTGVEYSVLLLLLSKIDYECEVDISQQELASQLKCQQQVISRAILKLEKEDLIQRPMNKKGRQCIYLLNPRLCIRGDEKNRTLIMMKWYELKNLKEEISREKSKEKHRGKSSKTSKEESLPKGRAPSYKRDVIFKESEIPF